jgi:hypothetical protein
MPDTTLKIPCFYLSLQQVRDSGLLSAERLAEIDAEISRRLTNVFDSEGRVILNTRCADLSPYGRFLYPKMDHETGAEEWAYAKGQIMTALLTEDERKLLNDNAFTAQRATNEARAFDRAQKVAEEEWDGWVCYGDDYFPSVEDLHDRLACDGVAREDYPTYCWATRKQRVIQGLDAESVVEHCLDAWGWEDMDLFDLNGIPQLRAALEAFEKANADVVSYHEDRSIAVLLKVPEGEQ